MEILFDSTLSADTRFAVSMDSVLLTALTADVLMLISLDRAFEATFSAERAWADTADNSFEVTDTPPPPAEIILLTTFDSALWAETLLLTRLDRTECSCERTLTC